MIRFKFQGKEALLNSSFINCPQGGVVTLIVDPVIAQQAAEFISNNNKKEVIAQGLSKFAVGLIGGFTGGANLMGVSLAIGFDIWLEDSKSRHYDFKESAKGFGKQTGAGLLIAGGQEMSDIRKLTAHNQGVQGNVTRFSTEAANAKVAGNNSKAWSRELAAQMEKSAFKDFDPSGIRNIDIGIGGAVVGFMLEQAVNEFENRLYTETDEMTSTYDATDSKNNIGVIAVKK